MVADRSRRADAHAHGRGFLGSGDGRLPGGTREGAASRDVGPVLSGTGNDEAVIRRRSGVVYRQFSDERAVLLDLDSAGYFSLNHVGAVTWELLETPCTLPELVARLRARFDDPPESIGGDVQSFVAALQARELVEECHRDAC